MHSTKTTGIFFTGTKDNYRKGTTTNLNYFDTYT